MLLIFQILIFNHFSQRILNIRIENLFRKINIQSKFLSPSCVQDKNKVGNYAKLQCPNWADFTRIRE